MAKQRYTKNTPSNKEKKAAPPAQKTLQSTAKSVRGGILVGILAAVLGFILYANTLGHQYCLDDYSAIKDNWVVKGGLKNLGIIFSTEYRYGAWSSPGSLYRPLALSVFAATWQTWPDQPYYAHLINVLCYALTGFVLWATWRRILSAHPPVLAALMVLFFMAHPVHTEVVANIKSLDEILATLLCTVSLYGAWRFFEGNNPLWMIMALVSYALALFSKESAATFLPVFFLVIWFFSGAPLAKNIAFNALFVIPLAIFLWKRNVVLGTQSFKEEYSILDNFIVGADGFGSRLASSLMMCWRYLQALLLPVQLVSDLGYQTMKPVGFGNWMTLLGSITYIGMGVWALIYFLKKHILSFAVFLFLISFGLYSNVVVLIGTSYGERLLYVPSLAFALALAYGLTQALKINDSNSIWNPGGKGLALWGIAGLILAFYSIRTITRNPDWYNSYTLYAADHPKSPECAKLNYHLGLEQVKKGLNDDTKQITDQSWVEKGIASYTKAIELYPKYHDAYGSRGLAYFHLKKFENALSDYNEALKYRPNDATVLSNLGYIYFMQNQLEKAEEVYRKAIKYDPRFVDARRNLGAILAMKKQFPEAIEQWQEGLKYAPDNLTLVQYIGFAYRDMGQLDKAQPWLDKAKKMGGK